MIQQNLSSDGNNESEQKFCDTMDQMKSLLKDLRTIHTQQALVAIMQQQILDRKEHICELNTRAEEADRIASELEAT